MLSISVSHKSNFWNLRKTVSSILFVLWKVYWQCQSVLMFPFANQGSIAREFLTFRHSFVKWGNFEIASIFQAVQHCCRVIALSCLLNTIVILDHTIWSVWTICTRIVPDLNIDFPLQRIFKFQRKVKCSVW